MGRFKFSKGVDKNKMFLVNSSALEGRLDPHFYRTDFFQNKKLLERMNLIKLADCSGAIFSGITPKSGGEAYCDQSIGIPFIRSGDFMEEGGIDFSKVIYIKPEVHSNIMKGSQVRKNDMFFAIVGATIGKVGIYNDKRDANINQAIAAVRLKKDFNPKFVRTFFLTPMGQKLIERIKRPVARANINLEEIGALTIPNITIERQNEIVKQMDSAYAAKEQKEKEAQKMLDSIDDYLLGELGIKKPRQDDNSIKNKIFIRKYKDISGKRFDPYFYKPYYDSTQKELNRTKTKPLSELLEMIESGSRPSGGVSNIHSGILSFGGEHINNQCEVTSNKLKYIPKIFHDENKKTETKLGDLLLVKDGATTGKIGIVENLDHSKQNINEHLFLLRTNNQVNSFYLLYYLNSYIGQAQIKKSITGGTITGITRGAVCKISVILPKPKKQKEIARHISKIRARASQLQDQANTTLENAKNEVEVMILSKSN